MKIHFYNDIEHVVLVTAHAGLRCVLAHQREELVVVEAAGASPAWFAGPMATLAAGRETRRRMIRRGRAFVGRAVTAHAVAGRAGEQVVLAAAGARLLGVEAHERVGGMRQLQVLPGARQVGTFGR